MSLREAELTVIFQGPVLPDGSAGQIQRMRPALSHAQHLFERFHAGSRGRRLERQA